jgi:beta-aspartyl-peptidase (threonine type)
MIAAIAIHGGAGTIPRDEIGDAGLAAQRAALRDALLAGWAVLTKGGLALDAVETAVLSLENTPCFNAGHGAVFNAAGNHELDAAIMDGRNLAAGAVAGARSIRNPIRAARLVMERSDCVLLAGAGADDFAAGQGLAPVSQEYFSTALRRRYLDKARAVEAGLAEASASEAEKHGTVGAVAVDHAGNLAAASSTGGFTNKRVGRIGDTPVIGAGTYARNGLCAVSCTGRGEFLIRHVVGHEIAARMAYRGDTLETAAHGVIVEELTPLGGGAGLIAVDASGNVVMPFNTPGMYRGSITPDGRLSVGIYHDLAVVETLR